MQINKWRKKKSEKEIKTGWKNKEKAKNEKLMAMFKTSILTKKQYNYANEITVVKNICCRARVF